jgi:hypothetical protein
MTFVSVLLVALAQAPAGPPTVSGQVVDADGRPVSGVEVLLSGLWRAGGEGRPVLSLVTSDAQGRFRLDVPAEKDPQRSHFKLALWAYEPKLGLAGQAFSPSELAKVGAFPLKLSGPVHTALRVVGPDGKPVNGARVAPVMVKVPGGLSPTSSFPAPDALADLVAATTDTEGKGEIKGLRSENIEAVLVEAAGFGRQGSELGASPNGIATITLKPAGRLIGRIEADDPATTRGLKVIALTLPQTRDGPAVSGDGSATTDDKGRFEIPALAAGKLALNVFPAEGAQLRPRLPSNLTIEPGKTTEVTIPLEGPARLRTVAGRVVGLGGEPVDGVTVFQTGGSPEKTEALTDAQGRFKLSGVVARQTFLFARKAGYRFAGLAIGADEPDALFPIHRVNEPPLATRTTLPPLMPHDQELILARRLLDPYAALVLEKGGEQEKVRTMEAMARVEPERVLELIEKKIFNIPFLNGMMGLRVASALMEESLDEALAVLEGLEDPAAKAIGYIEASTKLPAENRAKALELLERALLSARAAKEPDGMQLVLIGQVAERFLDLGEAERGRAILREGEALAKQLPKAGFVGYARGAFAEELVQIDLEAGLALANDITEPREFDRHHGNIAHELANRDPAQAERVLAMVKDTTQRDQYAVRVVYRMGAMDLARARRLAEALSDVPLKGYALGMIALSLAEAGKDSAREVLEHAYATLERAAESGPPKPRSLYYAVAIAGALLPVAERIDSKLVDEYLWRSIAMRQPAPWQERPDGQAAEADVELAMMVARYDRLMARSLVEPLGPGKGLAFARFSNRGEFFVAAAVIDPKWAVELVEALTDDPDLKPNETKNGARLAVAEILGRTARQRWRKLQHNFLFLWIPDIEDNDINL